MEGTIYRGILDTGATHFIAASRIVTDRKRKNVCAVKIGDGNYTYSKGEKEVEVVSKNFGLDHTCIVMDTTAFDVCIGMNFIRETPELSPRKLHPLFSRKHLDFVTVKNLFFLPSRKYCFSNPPKKCIFHQVCPFSAHFRGVK